MGGGASTPVSQKADGKPSKGDSTKKAKETDFAPSPFDDIASEDVFGGDDKGDGNGQKAVASATKLKRMAFGQQTYMDQQRDYDQTLSKLELNKTGVVDWKEPMSGEKGSPQKTPKGVTPIKINGKFPDASFQSPSDAKANASTPDAAKKSSTRKPPPPAAKPAGTPVQNPTQQVVQAPSHAPSRAQQPQYGYSPMSSLNTTSPMSSLPSTQDGAGAGYGGQTHYGSFSAQSHNIQKYPDHSSSGTQLLPHHNVNNQMAAQHPQHPQAVPTGPPAGLVSRPFPGGQQPPLDSTSNDADDMIGDFGRSVKADNFKKPDNVPLLNIHTAAGGDASGRVQPPRNNPNLGPTMPALGPQNGKPGNIAPANMQQMHGPGQMAPGQQQPGGRPAMGIAGYPNGGPAPNMHGQPRGQPGPMGAPGSAPSPIVQPMRPGMPQATPPSTAGGSGMRPTPAPVPHGGAPVTAPVVKETKNVKRNRAQIPTKLAHALPTTGDWMNKRYIVNNYILLEVLGTGSYGEVRLCKDRTTDKLFAIKIFSKDFLKKKKTGKSDETFFEDIKREIAIMKKLLHPNVLRLFEVLDDPKVNKMYLVLEYMKMGDLINVLKSRGADAATNTVSAGPDGSSAEGGAFTPLTDLEVWNIFRQVVSGIRYLHYQNVVHGDIKPQNLLLGEDGLVKIADFGISQMLSASGQKLADAAGTPAFMSPELCEGKSFSGQLADIWAIGATMFMLRFGHPPFLAKSIINLYHKICNDPLVFPGPIDPGLKNLLENMLEKDPNKRYTLQQIIMHPWFRHPPAVHAAQQQLRAATAQGGGQGQAHAPGQSQGGAATHGSDRNAASQQANAKAMSTAGSAHAFMPPDSYAAEEEAAMKVPVKIEHNDEVYMSIGGIQKPGKSGPSHHSSDGKIDEEGKNSEYNSENEGVEDAGEENMMNTDWGADVFQMIDDGDNSDNNIDDDSVDEDSDAETSDKFGDSGKKGPFGSDGSLMATRTEMTAEEGEKRAKRFKAKIAKKSNEDMELDKRNGSSHGSSQSSTTSPTKSRAGNSQAAVSFDALSVENLSSAQNASKTAKLPFKSVSVKAGPRSRGDSIRSSTVSRDEYDNEDADEVSMEDLSKIMDTLAMQPKNFSNMTDEGVVAGGLLPIEGFSAEILNKKNGMAAAFNSEKGCRHTQEDRCVLLPNAAQVKGAESGQLDASRLELLSQFSIGCIFDGHSGWRCAQYLSQHFVPTLVGHPRFLDKTCEAALTEVCAEMDSKVCDMLLDEEDSSGSTGVIAVYDGRRHVFTVAGVGDSMCVISRAGKAVIINRMHRLDNEDERERVKRAGGTVINNRVNGLLAISRAFGDTQFKPERDETNSTRSPEGLVISTPEVFSELITPMTEFAIMATDGLWDVMTPQMAVTFVRNMLHKHRDLEEAARSLTKEAITRGSVDNVTALVMSFHFSDEGKIKSGKY